MNERIKQLIKQATVPGYMLGESYVQSRLDEQKFAELIVNHATECVRDVLREEDSDLSYTAATQVQNKIKQFFGVEE